MRDPGCRQSKSILDQKEAAKLKRCPYQTWGVVTASRTSLIVNEPAAIASFTKNTHLTLYASRFLLCAGWGGTNGKFHFKKEAGDLNISFENQWEVTLKIYYTDELLANCRKSQARCAQREA